MPMILVLLMLPPGPQLAFDVPFTSSIDAVASSATAGIVDAFADANASGFVVATSGATGKMSYERAF